MNQQLQPIEYSNQRILTTQQLAVAYETTPKIISQNFTRNKNRYTVGKHYFYLDGEELKTFRASTQFELMIEISIPQFEDNIIDKKAPVLYLWTEKGALMHAKSLNTDKAWQAYEMLVDGYYRLQSLSLQGAFDVRELLTMPTREEFNEQIKRLRQIRREMLKALTPRKISPPTPRKPYAPRQPKPARTFEEEVMYVLNGLSPDKFYSARFISHQTVLLRLVGAPKVRALLNEKTEEGTIAKTGTGKRATYQLVK